jgi:hypothetical protein
MTDPAPDPPRRAFGFDSKIQDFISQRREALSAFPPAGVAGAGPQYDGVLFDQLVVVGAPIARGSDQPRATILVAFPASPLLLGAAECGRIGSFCFPHGFHAAGHRSGFLVDQFVFQLTSAVREPPV